MTARRERADLVRRVVNALGPTVVVGALGAVTMLSFQPPGMAVLLLLVQCLPLLVRARFPRAVLGITAAGAVAQVLAGYPPSNAFLGQAVALATVVGRTPRPWSLLLPVLLLAANAGTAWSMGVAGVGRLAVIQATTFALAWALGDAASRRRAVAESIEEQLASRLATAELRTRLAIMSERLRIARELHAIASAGFDDIASHAAAASRRLAHGSAVESVQAIEATARRILAELDRFLGLLRRAPADDLSALTEGVASEHETTGRMPLARAAGQARHIGGSPHRETSILSPDANAVVSLAVPALVVAVLTVVDGLTGEGGAWPTTAPVLWYAAAASLPLLARRRHPVAVMVLVTLASAVPLAMGLAVADGPLGIVVAAHALASHRSRRWAIALAVGAVGTISLLAGVQALAYAAQLGSLLALFSAVAVYVGETDQLARGHLITLGQRLHEAEQQDHLREQAALAEQRAAAARELHDSLGHSLSLVVVQAGAARLALSTGATPDRVAEILSAIEASVRTSRIELGRGLDPHSPPAGPVIDAMQDSLESLAAAVIASGTPVQVQCSDLGDVPASVHTAVYRLVQEALTNVVKHAPGAAAAVMVGRCGDVVQVRITNTPSSLKSSDLPSGSRGLAGMRERAALFGGSCRAASRPDGGFVVDASLPVPAVYSPTSSQRAAMGR